MFSENCVWTAPVWADHMSAPAKALPGTDQKGILRKDPQKCLQKSTLGGHSGGNGVHLRPKAPKRVAEGSQKGGANDPKIHKSSEKIRPGRPRGSRPPPGYPKDCFFMIWAPLFPESFGSFLSTSGCKKRDEDATQYPKIRDSGPLTRSLHRQISRP